MMACHGGASSSVCKSMGVTIPLVCSKNDSAACTSDRLVLQAVLLLRGGVHADDQVRLGPRRHQLQLDDGTDGATACAAAGRAAAPTASAARPARGSSTTACGSLRSWTATTAAASRRRTDHTAGLMTYGLLAAATAGIGVRWALGGQLPRARTRSAGLLESSPGEGPELQGRGSPEE
ncbi:unnamed protein product [Prorocentrum cordatum]|uniref:Uncharacterized protein n=1 Tax=Prorocentrum cordatum TaxID=2364126 RepID=A0ABN9WM28_9DINO|nr:unnamed protein product [Polarella glacialis]